MTYLSISLIWGSSWIAGQPLAYRASSLADRAEPLASGALRLGLAALLLAPLCRRAQLVRHAQRDALILSLSMLALPYALAVWAGTHATGGWTPLLYAALPLLAAADGWRPLMIAAVGATFVVLDGALPLTLERSLWALPILLAVALQAFALHYARRHPPQAAGLALQFILAAAVLAWLSRIFEAPPRIASLADWSRSDRLWLAALAGPATALAYLLYYRLLRDFTPAQAASTQWLQFVVSAAESAVIFRVRPPWMMLAGMAVLVACSARMLFPKPEDAVTIRLTPPG